MEDIVRYIAQDNPLAAEKFGLRLVDRAGLLADFPELRQLYHKRENVRRLCDLNGQGGFVGIARLDGGGEIVMLGASLWWHWVGEFKDAPDNAASCKTF